MTTTVAVTITSIGKARLVKLAEHLRSGKLAHDRFNVDTVSRCLPCGTSGCAMGELPTVFPDAFRLSRPDHLGRRDLVRVGSDDREPRYLTANWFEIEDDAVLHLFYPESQNVARFGGRRLARRSRRAAVAQQIEAFLKRAKVI